jgi:hypothetical protein
MGSERAPSRRVYHRDLPDTSFIGERDRPEAAVSFAVPKVEVTMEPARMRGLARAFVGASDAARCLSRLPFTRLGERLSPTGREGVEMTWAHRRRRMKIDAGSAPEITFG